VSYYSYKNKQSSNPRDYAAECENYSTSICEYNAQYYFECQEVREYAL
jgi:hypothetical protein